MRKSALKVFVSLFLSLSFMVMPVICSASQVFTVTEEKLNSLDKKLEMLQNEIELSKATTTNSGILIRKLQTSLERAEALVTQSAIIIEKQKLDLQKQEQSYKILEMTFEKSEKAHLAKEKSLRKDRTFLEIIIGGIAVYEIQKAFK